jgi:hypothetical protein
MGLLRLANATYIEWSCYAILQKNILDYLHAWWRFDFLIMRLNETQFSSNLVNYIKQNAKLYIKDLKQKSILHFLQLWSNDLCNKKQEINLSNVLNYLAVLN